MSNIEIFKNNVLVIDADKDAEPLEIVVDNVIVLDHANDTEVLETVRTVVIDNLDAEESLDLINTSVEIIETGSSTMGPAGPGFEVIPGIIVPASSTLAVYSTIATGRHSEFFLTCYDSVNDLQRGLTVNAYFRTGQPDWVVVRGGDRLQLGTIVTEVGGIFTVSIINNETVDVVVSGFARIA